MSLTCLDRIIGLDSAACTCFADGLHPAAIANILATQQFDATTTHVLTWTENAGVLPVNPDAIWVFQNGQKLNYSTGDFTIANNTGFQESRIFINTSRWVAGDYFEVVAFQEVPLDYATSNTGFYMTDVEYGLPIREAILSSADCSQDNIWQVMNRARSEAIRDFKRDLLVYLDMYKVKGVTAWRGAAGKTEVKAFTSLNVDYAGQLIRAVNRTPHRKLVINAIWAGFTTTGTTNLTLRSNKPGWVNQVIPVAHTANGWTKTTLATPIVIDLYDTLEAELYYALTYPAQGVTVMNNKLYCCGGASWANLFSLSGVSTNNLDDLREQWGRGADGLGLVIEGHTDCADLDWICELPELGGQQMYETIGLAVLCKATVRLLSQLLDSGVINHYTLLMDQQGYAKRDFLSARYGELLQWIAKNLPPGASGCWGCNKNSFFNAKMMV